MTDLICDPLLNDCDPPVDLGLETILGKGPLLEYIYASKSAIIFLFAA